MIKCLMCRTAKWIYFDKGKGKYKCPIWDKEYSLNTLHKLPKGHRLLKIIEKCEELNDTEEIQETESFSQH